MCTLQMEENNVNEEQTSSIQYILFAENKFKWQVWMYTWSKHLQQY